MHCNNYHNKKKKLKIMLIILIILLFTILNIFLYFIYNYTQGKKAQSDKSYEKAISYYKNVNFVADEIKSMEDECYYQRAIELREKKKFDNSIDYFNKIINYKDTQEQLKETQYQKAITNYNNGLFIDAKQLFSKINNFKNCKEYLNNIETIINLQGIWQNEGYVMYEIKGWKINVYLESIIGKYIINNKHFFVFLEANLEINNNEIKLVFNNGKNSRTINYNKNTDIITDNVGTFTKQINCEIKKEAEKQRPQIGMTKLEIENSTWGKPKDINKTTTAYGTQEQWCYSGYRYIYFENGIVTAIQE